MSFFKTAYDTTVGRSFVTSKITHAIREVLVIAPSMNIAPVKSFNEESREPILAAISGRTTYESDVPGFVHPLIVEALDKKKYLFIDLRPFVRPSPDLAEGEYLVKNASEYKLARARLAMNKVWLTTGADALSGLSMLPQNVFAAWVSEAIAHRFALDASDQLKMAIIAHFYYQSLFVQESEFDEALRDKFTAGCIRSAGRIPAKFVFETTSKITKLENIQDFCTTVQTILENPRLKDFSSGILIAVLKGSWFGTNAAEMLAVSLEHPPTWISLIYTAMAERTFRNSNLTKITERFSKSGAENYFTRGFVSLAQSVTQYSGNEDNF